jgi:amino acid adenylation domain-containing protein/thioester reductase-like protein
MQAETVLDLFAKRLAENATALAVVGEAESLTYAELNDRSSRVAAFLQSRDIGLGDYVLVQGERSIELIVAFLGVLQCGAGFVPMDRRLPSNRKAYIARQCAASIMLSTQSADRESLSGCETKTVNELLTSSEAWSYEPAVVQPDDAIYVIFTSGTTGEPKGVVIEHHSVAQLMTQHNRDLGVTTSSRCSLMAAVGFDVCQLEIWSALTAGACLYVLDQNSLLSSDAYLSFCVAKQITHGFVPTLKIYDILNARQPQGLALNCLYTAGEKLHPVEVDHLPYRVFDCYGPTEATIYVTRNEVRSKRLQRPASIGYAIDHCRIHILDEHLNELAAGEVGELCIAGPGLARGYLGAPDLTAQRFIYSPALKCRLYRSADQARVLPDGRIQFLGRMDGQTKIRGYRIEIGEIESRLLKEPNLNSAAVVVQDTGSQAQKRLVAFVVPRNRQVHSGRLVAELRRSLGMDLPDYMVPELFYRLDSLPGNVNGKVDRSALLTLLQAMPPAVLDIESFTPGPQRALARIWFDMLGHADFGPQSNFLNVGGHSLGVAGLAEKLSAQFNIHVVVRDIYEHLVLEDLAAELHRRTRCLPEGTAGDRVHAFEADGVLQPDIRFAENFEPAYLKDPRHSLLTGATGFVGIHLLHQLLVSSTAHIHCPIRCDSAVAGLVRLQQISERYQVPISESDWKRIHVYASDLAEEHLGLEEEVFIHLTRCVDVVYHSASAVNFIMPYSYMRRDNVAALTQILHFCAAHKTKALMLMSTISIYSWGHRFTHKSHVYEQDDIDENLPAIRDDLGYVQSKWVMEKLADLAASRGLPLMTFRLGYATCHSVTGESAHYQWWGRFIRTCLSYGAVPDLVRLREGLTTVDFMVEAVAHISRNPQALGSKFNLCQPEATNLDLKAFCEQVGEHYGRKLSVVAYKKWVELWKHNSEALLYPLLGMFKDPMHAGQTIFELYQENYSWDRSNTMRFLDGSGIRETQFSSEVMARYLDKLEQQASRQRDG